MTTKPLRCKCCGLVAGELAEGVCLDCAEGNHQVHCGKPVGEKAEARAAAPAPAAAAAETPNGGNGGQTQAVVAAPTATPASKAEMARPEGRTQVTVGERGLQVASLDELVRVAKYAVEGGFAPNMTLVQAVAAMQFGLEVGLTPFQALSSVAVINGKPALYGDGARGIVEASGELEDTDEWFEHQGKRLEPGRFPTTPDDTTTAFCMIKRRGRTAQTRSFSVADAKRAQLWGKTGRDGKPTPWVTYPQRMLAARAAGFARRDVFPDRLKGFRDEFEARDIIDVSVQDERPTVEMPRRASESVADKETPAS